jgi:hypothetical protein
MLKSMFVAMFLFVPSIAGAVDQPTSPCTIATPAPTAPSDSKDKKKDKKSKDKNDNNLMLLSRVVCEVEQALDAYQQSDDVDKGVLPKLATADFDFKTVVDTKGGPTINLFIFKFGATVEKQDTNDVDFKYVPKSLLKTAFEGGRTKSLQQELIDTIRSAAKAIVEQAKDPSPAKDPLVFKQLSVTISYGVTWDANGGINAPISLVTLGASIDHSKNNVQQVKVVFSPPEKSKKEKEE